MKTQSPTCKNAFNEKRRPQSIHGTTKSASSCCLNFENIEDLPPKQILTASNDLDQQLKLAHEVVDVDRANGKVRAPLLGYYVDKPENSYAQVRFSARKMEDKKIQQIVYVVCKPEEIIHLNFLMNSVDKKVIVFKPISNVL